MRFRSIILTAVVMAIAATATFSSSTARGDAKGSTRIQKPSRKTSEKDPAKSSDDQNGDDQNDQDGERGRDKDSDRNAKLWDHMLKINEDAKKLITTWAPEKTSLKTLVDDLVELKTFLGEAKFSPAHEHPTFAQPVAAAARLDELRSTLATVPDEQQTPQSMTADHAASPSAAELLRRRSKEPPVLLEAPESVGRSRATPLSATTRRAQD